MKNAHGKVLPQRRRGAEKTPAEKSTGNSPDLLGETTAPLRLCGEVFSSRLIRWHKRHGRHDLPWQNTTDPYRVWLSEIMLQQTQVATVIPYYQRFLARFPALADLAAAPVEEIMALWLSLIHI